MITGPVLSDEKFYGECLNLEYDGMGEVKGFVAAGDYRGAGRALAAHIRRFLMPERYFSIPFDEPKGVSYKYPGESDEDACRRVRDHVLIAVAVPCDFGRENTVDWRANPTVNQYREWTWQLNRHSEWRMLALEFRRTQKTYLAETAAELFRSWVRQAVRPEDCPGGETDCWRTIECGIRMSMNWPCALHAFCTSSAFTDDLLTDWYKSVWEHGQRLSSRFTSGNWLFMEMNGLAQIGILYPQFRLSDQWRSQAFAVLEDALEKQLYPDGFQYELAPAYHDVMLENYQRLIETAAAYEVRVPDNILKKLAGACKAELALMMPDGFLPEINDSKRLSVEDSFRVRQRIFPKDRSVRWGIKREEADRPSFESAAFPWSGFLAMRTGWDRNAAWALFDAAPFGTGHQHEDKLSLLFYAGGKLLLAEGGNYAYDSSEMRSYVISSRAHNTVRVDGLDQNRRENYKWKEEELFQKADLVWKFGREWDFGESCYRQGYGKGSAVCPIHRRRVYFHKRPGGLRAPYLIVADRMESFKCHEYEWLWHIDSVTEGLESGRAVFQEITVVFSTGRPVVLKGQREPEWQGFISDGIQQGMYREIPCLSVKAEAATLRMITVLAPRDGNCAGVSSVEADVSSEADEILIHYEDGSDERISERELILTLSVRPCYNT